MRLPPLETMLGRLVALPSISSLDPQIDVGNRAVIDQLAEWLQQLGFEITLQPLDDQQRKFNLLARLGPRGPGGLLLAGHTDTVPYDAHRWTYDPFVMEARDDRLYGLGSADMKGFFAHVLKAVEGLDTRALQKPLYVLATADEEITMDGARIFYDAFAGKISPELALIGEPTELKPVAQHKGHMALRLSIQGQSGHASDPARGVNAIALLHSALGPLLGLQQQLAERYPSPSFTVPQPTLSLGQVHGGDSVNRICGECHLDMDLRLVPGISLEQMHHLVESSLAPVVEQHPGRFKVESLYPGVPAFDCGCHSHAAATVLDLAGSEPLAVNYATEAPFIQQLGCDTLVLGPGSIEQAHQPDEFLACSQLEPTRHLLQQIIGRICG